MPAPRTVSSSGGGARGWGLWQQDLAVCGEQRAGQARRGLPAPGAAGGAAGQARGLASVQPEHAVYTGPQAGPARRVTLRTLRAKHARGEPLTMVTAYDYPSAVHVPPRAAPAPLYLPAAWARHAWARHAEDTHDLMVAALLCPALPGSALAAGSSCGGGRLAVLQPAPARLVAASRAAHMHARAGETLTCRHKPRSAPGPKRLQSRQLHRVAPLTCLISLWGHFRQVPLS
jgi:hypothetical protein